MASFSDEKLLTEPIAELNELGMTGWGPAVIFNAVNTSVARYSEILLLSSALSMDAEEMLVIVAVWLGSISTISAVTGKTYSAVHGKTITAASAVTRQPSKG